jgi:predicted dehydrogenase
MKQPASEILRIAVIGAGAFGREHLSRLSGRQDAVIAGVADPSEAAADFVRQHYPATRLFSDPVRLLDEIRPDGVIVATPAATHYAITSAALGHGIPVLLEKPVLEHAAEAEKLDALTQGGPAFILPGHVLRFSADHTQLSKLVKSGAIGDVIYISSRRYRDAVHAERYADTDPVLMTLIHDIDLAIWLAPSPFVTVRGSRTDGPGLRSLTTADLETDSGMRCHLRTAWTFETGDLPADRLEVVGQHGSVELDAGTSLRLYAEGRCTALPMTLSDDPLANEQDVFLARIRNYDTRLPVTMADAISGLTLADAILSSLNRRQEVKVRW